MSVGELTLTAEQLLWGAGVLLAALVILKYVIKSVKDIIENAKGFVRDTVGPRPDIPAELKKSLMNGAGDVIRQIVRNENEMQTKLHQQETRQIVKDAIMEHEKVESAREADAHQRLMDEITSKYNLKRKAGK